MATRSVDSSINDKARSRSFLAEDLFTDRYIAKKTIGKGTFGETKLAQDKHDNSLWAVKILDISLMAIEDRQSFQLECKILQELPQHANLCFTREYFQAEKKVHIVCELLSGGELFDRILQKEFYSEIEAIVVIAQIASALQAVHNIGVVHRDLKPENILYSNMSISSTVKVVDFGMSAFYVEGVDDPLTQPCGTVSYAAPEVINSEGYNQQADMWSLGVISYILLSGMPPFDDEDEANLFDEILHGEIDFKSEEWNDISVLAQNFVGALMDRDKEGRLDSAGVLNHPWITESLTRENVNSASAAILSKCLNPHHALTGAKGETTSAMNTNSQVSSTRKKAINLSQAQERLKQFTVWIENYTNIVMMYEIINLRSNLLAL